MRLRCGWPNDWGSGGYLTRLIATRRPPCGAGPGKSYHPPPPPPPPPPPEKPPPPEPLLEPGAVEAELIAVESEEPTSLVKRLGSSHGLWLPAYHANP